MTSNSTLPPQDDPEFIQFVQSIADLQTTRYVGFAALAVLLYDSILTFKTESKVIWTKQIRLGGVLYILARYSNIIALTLGVTYFIEALNPSLKLCSALNTSIAAVSLAGTMGIRGLLFGRAYAVCFESKWLKATMTLLFAFIIGVIAAHIHFSPCNAPDNAVITIKTLNTISIAIFEAVVVAVTIHHAWRERGILTRALGISRAESLNVLFVRQGIIRFIIIFVWTLGAAIEQKLARPEISGIDSSIESSISVILICRFMLDLLQVNAHPNGTGSSLDETHIGSFHAAIRVIDESIMADFADNGQLSHTASIDDSEDTHDQDIRKVAHETIAGITLEEYL